ncbi:MAG: glycosyltransferase family 2 protein [bacterium]
MRDTITPDLTISIVNSNNRSLLEPCLRSIYEGTKETAFEIIVTDNCSEDGSVDVVRDKFPGVQLILNTGRKGFSTNHNRAMCEARGRWIVLLNDDTVVLPGCFDRMANFIKGHSDIGVLGCKILNPDMSLQRSCYRLPTLSVLFFDTFFLSSIFSGVTYIGGYKRWDHNAVREVPFVSGAAMMFPRDVIERAGYLDERFYTYSEDADLCKRVREAGWKVVFFPEAQIIHYGGGAAQVEGYSAFDNFHRSQILYFRKHYGLYSIPLVYLLDLVGAFFRLPIFTIIYILIPSMRERCKERISFFRRRILWYLGIK